MEQMGSYWTEYHEILNLRIFRKYVEKPQVSLKSDKNNEYLLHIYTNIYFLSYLVQFYLEWEMFYTDVVDKIKTHIVCSITSFQKMRHLWEEVEVYFIAGQATDEDMA